MDFQQAAVKPRMARFEYLSRCRVNRIPDASPSLRGETAGPCVSFLSVEAPPPPEIKALLVSRVPAFPRSPPHLHPAQLDWTPAPDEHRLPPPPLSPDLAHDSLRQPVGPAPKTPPTLPIVPPCPILGPRKEKSCQRPSVEARRQDGNHNSHGVICSCADWNSHRVLIRYI